MKKLLVILGPTATGKTDLGLQLAKRYNGELVSCDSRQVYTGLDIGTGKEPREKGKTVKGQGFWEINGRKIWLYDLADAKVQFTVYNYVEEATKVIKEIESREKLPIIVGGTGFYLKALLSGIDNLSAPIDQKLRKKLAKLSVGELQKKLQALSPGQLDSLNESDRQNSRRLIRKIEIVSLQPMNPYMEQFHPAPGLEKKYQVLKIGLTAPREMLYKNIDSRILSRLDQGMIKEAEELRKKGLTLIRMRQLGLEYGVLADYLAGVIKDQTALIKIMQGKIHGYLRRQQTWFKKESNVSWFDITDHDFTKKVEILADQWYHRSDDQTD